MPPIYDFTCETCQDTYDLMVKYDERDSQTCPVCSSPVIRHFPSPMILKASHHDGIKRRGWAEMREASKLNKEAASSGSEENRKAIAKEIREKLKVNIQK